MTFRYATVCSGIEAPSAAWHSLGWEPIFFSEIGKFPCALLYHHYPNVPNHGDMTKFKEWPNATIDVLAGGTPCQSFSIAGLRKGLDDPNGNLTLVYLAIAARYRPKWLVWENVPGVLSDSTGAFGTFLAGLGQLGYGFAYRILDAQYFGVAQRRRRVFVVGYLGDWRRAAAVLFERHSLQGHPAPRREKGQSVAPTVARGSPGGRTYGLDADTADSLIARCLTSHPSRSDGESETFIAYTLRSEGFDASEDGTGRGVPLVCGTLTSNGDAHTGFKDEHGLVAFGWQNSASQATVRRLTPRECERLQGFPDDYTLVPYRRGMAADSPRYKALGNSMAVPVMRWIGDRIVAVEEVTL